MATLAHTTFRTTALERAHSDLTALIAAARPPSIARAADASDAAIRAAHMADVHQAVIEYLEAVMADTIDRLPVGRGCRRDVELLLWDALNQDTDDLAGKLADAGCRFAVQREAA